MIRLDGTKIYSNFEFTEGQEIQFFDDYIRGFRTGIVEKVMITNVKMKNEDIKQYTCLAQTDRGLYFVRTLNGKLEGSFYK